MRALLVVLVMVVGGCSAGAAGSRPDAPAGTEVSEGDDVDDERARLLAQFKAKQRQCGTFGSHIEASEAGMAIVNLNDAAKLRQLATKRQQVGASTAELDISLPELVELRDRYRDDSDQMASALRETAEGKNVSQQKAALDRYRKLDADVTTLVDELNAFCAKPIEQ